MSLVGTFFCDEEYRTYVTNLKDFDIVFAVFDPKNEHDNNAIRVISNREVRPQFYHHIGWIAKHQTIKLREYLENNIATAQMFFDICDGQYAIPLNVKRLKPGFSAGCVELWTDNLTLTNHSWLAADVI